MSRVLIIDSGFSFFHSGGQLNHHLAQVAVNHLKAQGHEVRLTIIDEGYVAATEVENISWADVVIYQQPAWWMGPPWQLKKYIDDVFTTGAGVLYKDDGRTRRDPSKKYGSGGLLKNKHYMISCTWNAPVEAFEEPKQFFEGKGVDAVYFPLHKANQFLGIEPLPTFMANDVMKDPDIQGDIERFRTHLTTHIPK